MTNESIYIEPVSYCNNNKGANYSVRKARYQNLFDNYEQEISCLEIRVFSLTNSLHLARKELKESKQIHSSETEKFEKELWQVKFKAQSDTYNAQVEYGNLLKANESLTSDNQKLRALIETLIAEKKGRDISFQNTQCNDYIYLHQTPYIKAEKFDSEIDTMPVNSRLLTQYSPESSTNEYDPLDDIDSINSKFGGSVNRLGNLIDDQIDYLNRRSSTNDIDYENYYNPVVHAKPFHQSARLLNIQPKSNQSNNNLSKVNIMALKFENREHSPSNQFFDPTIEHLTPQSPIEFKSTVSEMTKLIPPVVSSSITIKKKKSRKLGQLTKNTIKKLLHDKDNYRSKA